MSFAKLRQDYTSIPAPSVQVTAQLEGRTPTHSPARALQQQLAGRAAAVAAPQTEKWSSRRSVAVIVSTSAALWMALLMSAGEATKLIA